MGLARFDTVAAESAGVEIELKDLETGGPSGIFFRILGVDSKEHQRYSQMIADKNLSLAATGRDYQKSDAVRREEGIERMVICTVGWRDGDDPALTLPESMGGDRLEFSVQNCFRVYRAFPRILEQVADAVMNKGLFLSQYLKQESNLQK